MKIKYILTSFLLISTGLHGFAQNNVNSPYTMFGIGYIDPGGFARNSAMGGTGIALPSETSLNNINPASYHTIDSLHFIMETGVHAIYSKFSLGSQHQSNMNANFSYMAFGFRISKRWANSIGIKPYSNIGYSINSQKQIEGSTEYSNVEINGSGGLNQVYWGNSYKVTKNLSLGINASYLFGSISQTQETSNDYFSGKMQVTDESRLRNFYFSYGAQYSFKLSKDWSGMAGAVYGNKTGLKLKHHIDILDNSDTLSSGLMNYSNYNVPQFFGFGTSFNYKNKFVVTGDYMQNNWSGSNATLSGVELTNSNNIAIGVEFMPSDKPSANYLKVLKYRFGGYRENSYMKIDGKQLMDYGFTAGIGFPVMHGKTKINLSVAAGRKGIPGSGSVISENYYKFSLNFTLLDYWFNRSKYD